MWIMAGAAVFVRYRPVVFRVVRKEFFEIDQLPAVVINNSVLTMASDAKIEGQTYKQVLNVCPVRVVAIDTRLVINRCIVFYLGLGGDRFHFRMATETQGADIIQQQFGVFGIVGVVAIDAGFLSGCMAEFVLNDLGEILMAPQADFVSGTK